MKRKTSLPFYLLGLCAAVATTACKTPGTTAPATVPVDPFCSILITETFDNPDLREAMSTERTDPNTANHFVRVRGIAGPRGNPAPGAPSDIYAVREAWLRNYSNLAVVRAQAHPARRQSSSDFEASSWTIQSQDATGTWSGAFAGGSANAGNEVDDPAAGARTVPQLMTVGDANPQMFACAGGRAADTHVRTTWLMEITPPNPSTGARPSTMTIQDLLYGDDRFVPNAPGPLIGPAHAPSPQLRGPGDRNGTGAAQCAMTQVADDVATRQLHLLAIDHGVLYHSMASNFSDARSDGGAGFAFKRFNTLTPWADVGQALGGGFGEIVSATVVASRPQAISVLFVALKGTQYRALHAVRFADGSWRPVEDILDKRDGAGSIGALSPFNITAGMCPVYPETPGQQGDELVYVIWRNGDFASVGRVVSTPRDWGNGVTGIYSPISRLDGAVRGVDPLRNHTLLDFSISARPFHAFATPTNP